MLKNADVVDLLYPEPDDISVYLLNLSVIFLLLFDAALRSLVWQALVGGLGEEGDSIVVVVLLAPALLAALYMPFTRRNLRPLASFTLVGHALLLVTVYGNRVLSVLGAELPSVVDCLFVAYGIGWIVRVAYRTDVSRPITSLTDRRPSLAKPLAAGAAAFVIVFVGDRILDIEPISVYSFAAATAGLLHKGLEMLLPPLPQQA